MTLQIQRIGSMKELDGLAEEWRALETDLFPRTPFTSPLWNFLWWKHLRRQRAAIHDELSFHVLRREGKLVAIAPLMLTHAPARGVLRTRKLQFFGADPNLTEIRGLVVHPSDERAAVQALTGQFLNQQSEWDWLEWGGIRHAGGAAQWLETVPGHDSKIATQDFFVRLPASWAEFKSSRSRNIKESLRKCYNSLKRDGHRFSFRLNRGAAEVAPALGRFFELHSARSTIRSTVPHPDHFARDNARSFMLDYAGQMTAESLMHVFELEIGGRIVASRIGFALGKELFLYYSGFLPEWGRYSVMTTVIAETIQWAIHEGFTVINLSTGNDESKRRWSPSEAAFTNVIHIGPTWRNRLAFSLYRRSARLRQWREESA